MSRVLASCLLLLSLSAHATQRQTMKEFIDHLMSQMTDAEKVGQLAQYTADMSRTGPGTNPFFENEISSGRAGSVLNAWTPQYTRQLQELAVKNSRLGIPLIFALDVIHGHRTIFPIPLGESSSWNLPLIEKSARVAAVEASADGLHWTFAPMVDIARDPRWGRIMEGAGEDTYLGGLIGAARVRGFQGTNSGKTDEILSCVKHFAAYGAPIAGRDYNTVDLSERTLHEVYYPPYRAAIDAGAATVMTSFNEINGVPSTSNQWLLTKLLRDTWGFGGFVVTDYGAIKELMYHGVAQNLKRATELAFNAGVDMDMENHAYNRHLETLLAEGKADRAALDRSVRRVLEAKYRLGLFDDPYRFSDEGRAQKLLMAKEHMDHAREIARRSIVMLKNDNDVLPLKREGRVALIGPMVDAKEDMLGTWSSAGEGEPVITIREGMEKSMTGVQFVYAADGSIGAAVQAAQAADKVVIALGEPRDWSGEASSRTRIRLPEEQTEMLRAVRLTGKPVVLLLFNGRPLALEQEVGWADAVIENWYLGTQAGNAVADVLSGDYSPSGKLTVSFPYNEGQIPIFYAAKVTGRPMDPEEHYTSKYLDAPNNPLFPFGWGLSYAKFEYSNLNLSTSELDPSAVLTVNVTLTNKGAYAGEETVQMYVRDMVASVTRPIKELKGFQKVVLQPGESRVVSLKLTVEDLKFYDLNMVWNAEPGDFVVGVGGNSKELTAMPFKLMPAGVRLPLMN